MSIQNKKTSLDEIVSLCKRRGFVYQTADIYGGINGLYDFGPLGTLLKENIRSAWKRSLTTSPHTIVFLDGALIGPESVWEASGHVKNFHDPMVDCMNCKKRYRTDDDAINLEKACPHCGKKAWTDVRQFNMMFKTNVGAAATENNTAYLRPETAQSIFVNFKNIMSTSRTKIPFGVAQIGKAFRNEITPKQFLFRMREFEQMELEWFCTQSTSNDYLQEWIEQRKNFYKSIGINKENIRIRPHEENELAHYSTACSDIEYNFPFGWKELEGIAHRGTFDLTQHSAHSGKDLSLFNDETKESFTPTVIECSVGVDRLFLTTLFDAYHQDIIEGETRTVLKLHPTLAPIKVACFPLAKKLSEPTKKLYTMLKQMGISVEFDTSGSIGKRYRRHDEIGTPVCLTYDFESEADHAVTVRDRDTTDQERVALDQIVPYLQKKNLLGC